MGLRCALAALLVVVACQPMHSGRPEVLHDPAEKARPKVVTPPEAIAYVEECNVSFADDPATWHPRPAHARMLVNDGDVVQQAAVNARAPTAQLDGRLAALDKYRQALLENPYDAEATVKLALAYDAFLRKGCALAMLRRLTALTINPKFYRQANAQIQTVGDNPGWFKGYRNEALYAVGLPPQRSHPTP